PPRAVSTKCSSPSPSPSPRAWIHPGGASTTQDRRGTATPIPTPSPCSALTRETVTVRSALPDHEVDLVRIPVVEVGGAVTVGRRRRAVDGGVGITRELHLQPVRPGRQGAVVEVLAGRLEQSAQQGDVAAG